MPGFLAILIGGYAAVGFILIFAASNYTRVRLWRGIGSFLLGFPLGLLTYGWLGICLARVHSLSRFYSWPCGGPNIGHDAPFVASGLFWVGAWSVFLIAMSSFIPASSKADQRQ